MFGIFGLLGLGPKIKSTGGGGGGGGGGSGPTYFILGF